MQHIHWLGTGLSSIPGAHVLKIAKFTLFSLICVRIEEIEVKHITPNEEAIAICIA